MAKSTGGPAFPVLTYVEGETGDWKTDPGMTLRDFFAAQALPVVAEFTSLNPAETYTTRVSKCAYELADAMLAERDK